MANNATTAKGIPIAKPSVEELARDTSDKDPLGPPVVKGLTMCAASTLGVLMASWVLEDRLCTSCEAKSDTELTASSEMSEVRDLVIVASVDVDVKVIVLVLSELVVGSRIYVWVFTDKIVNGSFIVVKCSFQLHPNPLPSTYILLHCFSHGLFQLIFFYVSNLQPFLCALVSSRAHFGPR